MMKLDILSNSLDYFENAMELYQTANEYGVYREDRSQKRNKVKWKMAIVSIVQAMELLLKYGLSTIHETLIFKDIDKPIRSDKEYKTVSFENALIRLENFDKCPFSADENDMLRKVVRLRNEFIHGEVNYEYIDIKKKFAGIVDLYQKGYSFFLGNPLSFDDPRLKSTLDELDLFLTKMTVFRGEEVFTDNLDDIKEEITWNQTHQYIVSKEKGAFKRIEYGKEPLYNGGIAYAYEYCDDCLAKLGEFHSFGCDLEMCPVCHGQIISCECGFEIKEQENIGKE